MRRHGRVPFPMDKSPAARRLAGSGVLFLCIALSNGYKYHDARAMSKVK